MIDISFAAKEGYYLPPIVATVTFLLLVVAGVVVAGILAYRDWNWIKSKLEKGLSGRSRSKTVMVAFSAILLDIIFLIGSIGVWTESYGFIVVANMVLLVIVIGIYAYAVYGFENKAEDIKRDDMKVFAFLPDSPREWTCQHGLTLAWLLTHILVSLLFPTAWFYLLSWLLSFGLLLAMEWAALGLSIFQREQEGAKRLFWLIFAGTIIAVPIRLFVLPWFTRVAEKLSLGLTAVFGTGQGAMSADSQLYWQIGLLIGLVLAIMLIAKWAKTGKATISIKPPKWLMIAAGAAVGFFLLSQVFFGIGNAVSTATSKPAGHASSVSGSNVVEKLGPNKYKITVAGDKERIETRIVVPPDAQIDFEASGEICVLPEDSKYNPPPGFNRYQCPNGARDGGDWEGMAMSTFPVPGAPQYSLCAEIGGTDPFFVGSKRSLISRGGDLVIIVNDVNPEKNIGEWLMIITIHPSY